MNTQMYHVYVQANTLRMQAVKCDGDTVPPETQDLVYFFCDIHVCATELVESTDMKSSW